MIIPVRYGAEVEIEKNGKKQETAVPPRIALAAKGPFLQVVVTHPSVVQDAFKQQGKEVPTATIAALIDTGAKRESTARETGPVVLSNVGNRFQFSRLITLEFFKGL